MIYSSKQHAMAAAAEMSFGYAPSYACRTKHGWTVICSWRPLQIGQYGILEIAEPAAAEVAQ